MPEIQFGVNIRAVASDDGFGRFVRRADELGYDAVAVPDHLGAVSPFVALAGAAMVSTRLRLRTYVLNVGFWNPALLARDVATLDALSGGRVELGLGAGHMRREHEDAGLPWLPHAERVAVLEATLVEVRRRLADVDCHPPVWVGAMSGAGLAVAARHADVVAFAGLRQVEGAFNLYTGAETAARVEEVRRLAGDRPYRSDLLLQTVRLGDEPEEALDSPFVLFGRDALHAAEELRRRQDVYGFDSVTTHQANLEALGQVIAKVHDMT